MQEDWVADAPDMTGAQRRQWATGVMAITTLAAAGVGRRERERLLASGQLTRIRRGWYARQGCDPAVATALRVGGRITCVSVLERVGAWMPVQNTLHVRVAAGAPAARIESGVVHRVRGLPIGDDPVDDVEVALACAFRCIEPLDALVIADSLVNRGILPEVTVLEVAGRAPKAVRRLVTRYLEPASQSGTETIVRYHLRRRRYTVRVQRRIPRTGHVDLLVGDRLIIECDSSAFHTRDEHHAEDRRRDLESASQGYATIRLTYAMVRHDWPATWAKLASLLQHRQHRWTAATYRMSRRYRPGQRAAATRSRPGGDTHGLRVRPAMAGSLVVASAVLRPEP